MLQDEKYIPPECGPYHVCCRNPETSTAKPYEHKCGMRNPGGINGRILTPQATGEAEFGEWPWQVSIKVQILLRYAMLILQDLTRQIYWQATILRRDGSEYVFKCGGTLIDERHVITVAHCVDKLLWVLPTIYNNCWLIIPKGLTRSHDSLFANQ